MKKLICCLVLLVSIFSLVGCGLNNNQNETLASSDYLRIHIRANSNSMDDQNVKYMVKDKVVEFLTPIIALCKSKEEMQNAVNSNLRNIESVANEVLNGNGFNYTSKAYLNFEYFPTKTYGDTTLEADFYDAIIVELGNADGNNWWCVVYPPLCFLNAEETSTEGFRYKSLIKELIDKFFN